MVLISSQACRLKLILTFNISSALFEVSYLEKPIQTVHAKSKLPELNRTQPSMYDKVNEYSQIYRAITVKEAPWRKEGGTTDIRGFENASDLLFMNLVKALFFFFFLHIIITVIRRHTCICWMSFVKLTIWSNVRSCWD